MLLELGDIDADTRRRNLAVIYRSSKKMSRLLDDLIDVAKAEGGGFAINAEPTDVAAILSTTLEEFRLQAVEAGVELTADVPPDLPKAQADGARVAQVLQNLCGNALKFTRRGGKV